MMRGFVPGFVQARVVGTLLAFAGAAVCTYAPAAAQGSYSPYDESASAALARYVRTLASSPKDFGALVGAGKAALALGDAQAAAGFFARADEVNPRSPLPQAGMGAVAVANGEPQAAMPYFTRAQQLGAPATTIACDRGLAYDLLGQQANAQADYRVALNGPDADEARRRLALSLAIGGDKAGALQTLTPLFAKRDPAAGRVRAFVLALNGDSNGAMAAINVAMPGSWSRVAPFLQRLPALRSDQKAAAVNLGIFPDSNGSALASASAPTVARYSVGSVTSSSVTTDRLAGIDDLLRGPPPAPQPTWQPASTTAPRVQVAYAAPVKRVQDATVQRRPSKVWLQLASGSNAAALPSQFRRIKSRGRDLFDGIKGYVARSPDRARLVIGPFRGSSDAQIFADDLQSVGVNAFRWTNSESDQIVPLGTE
jgi:Flp pilus assembly protein TadD